VVFSAVIFLAGAFLAAALGILKKWGLVDNRGSSSRIEEGVWIR
jgi:hypothetical protein